VAAQPDDPEALRPMISLKKYLECEADTRLPVTLTVLGQTLKAIGCNSEQSCPATGTGLKAELERLAARLVPEIEIPDIRETGKAAERELNHWGAASGEYLKQKTDEIKQILLAMAHAADGVAERDHRYGSRLNQLTSRLNAISRLDDISTIRNALVRGAGELSDCVQKMVEEGEQSVAELKAEVASYRSRLEEAENVASHDPLTGLFNRRRMEDAMNNRIREQRQFSLVMLDLKNFKAVNDNFGHLAGDNLLKQFAYELRCSVPSEDVVGRWGGDEFAVILNSQLDDARAMMERMQHWFNGEYSIPDPSGVGEVNLSAAVGIAQWRPGEGITELVARADRALLKQNQLHL
jgi:diguanylate cyclase (GGDEF)-like protein